jgi:ActR/RegA family two-component response regulator
LTTTRLQSSPPLVRSTSAFSQAGTGEVLVADDDTRWLQQVRALLERTGRTVHVARDGAEWQNALQRARFDLVIVEPNLPGRLWYSLLQDLRSVAPTARLVVTTAFPSRALARAARLCAAEAVLVKPVTDEQLDQVLRGGPPEAPAETPPVKVRSLARLEWEYINHVLHRCRGNVSEAARHLQLPRQTVYRKLRKHPPSC